MDSFTRFLRRLRHGTCAVQKCQEPVLRGRLCDRHKLPERLLASGAGASLPKSGPIHRAVWALAEATAAWQADA